MSKQLNNYRILKDSYVDPYGRESNPYYWIQQKKSFLGISYWKAIKHMDCGWGDCYMVKTQFKTYENAAEHIQYVLCKGLKADKHKSVVVDYITCTK
jgi:hypothetical protein